MVQTAARSAGAMRRLSLSEVWLVDRGFICSCGFEKKHGAKCGRGRPYTLAPEKIKRDSGKESGAKTFARLSPWRCHEHG
jgi:hypothetical protein